VWTTALKEEDFLGGIWKGAEKAVGRELARMGAVVHPQPAVRVRRGAGGPSAKAHSSPARNSTSASRVKPLPTSHRHWKRAKLDVVGRESPGARRWGGRDVRISTTAGLDGPQAQPNGE
jgi:hypothetical protein